MVTSIRIAGALIAGLIVAGCATTKDAGSQAVLPRSADNAACVSQTATRIPASNENCSRAGRTYTSEDIERTGQTSTADALQLMDPSITVHR